MVNTSRIRAQIHLFVHILLKSCIKRPCSYVPKARLGGLAARLSAGVSRIFVTEHILL